MNLITKIRLGAAASGLIDKLGAVPHGPKLTMVASVSLILSQWVTNNGGLFDDSMQPWIQVLLAVLNGAYSLSALGAPASGADTTSSIGAIISQVLLVTVQVMNSFLPVVGPYWQGIITDTIPAIQAIQASRWLRESAE